MRARNLKPGFFKNEALAELSFEARLLFAGLWCLADREGRLEDRPKRIKAEVFPYDDAVNVQNLLAELETFGFIHRYNPSPPCIWIPTFHRHQNPHKNEKPSELPAYSDIAKLPDSLAKRPDTLAPRARVSSSLNPSSLNPSSPVSCGKEEEERARLIDTLTPVENLKRRGGHRSEPETFGGLMAEVLGGGL